MKNQLKASQERKPPLHYISAVSRTQSLHQYPQKTNSAAYTNSIIHENVGQENKQSPGKNQRSSSFDTFIHQKNHKFLSTKKSSQNQAQIIGQNIDRGEGDDRQNHSQFVELYRQNLRRTVFNETKLMIRQKKKKKKYRIESLDPPGTYRGDSSMQMLTVVKKQHATLEQKQTKYNKKEDTLYKTIVPYRSQPQNKPSVNNELGISKFPLIKRKYKYTAMQNLQKMFDNLSKESLQANSQTRGFDLRHKGKPLRQNKNENKYSRSPSRQDLQPWDTFADQFID